MRFVDAWASLSPFDLFRLIVPAAVLTIACVLPGRPIVRAAAITLAIATLFMPEIGGWPLRLGWSALWIGVAMLATRRSVANRGPRSSGRAAFEIGIIGMLLGAILLVILIVGVAGQSFPEPETRQASYGVFLTLIGLIHLMLGRDVLRAAVSFGAAGLGLQCLTRAARNTVIEPNAPPEAIALIATAMVVVLCTRIDAVRRGEGGSSSVSHAHDLHD